MTKKLAILFLLLAALNAEIKDTVGLESIIIGADAMGRGGTYLGNDDSNHYVFQNYSFLNKDISPRASLTVFKLLSEINYLDAAYSQGDFSLGFLTIQDSGGYVRDAQNNLTGGKIGYSDTTLYGAYALHFANFELGARGKYHSKFFSEVDESAAGFSLDLAGSYLLNKYITLGAELNNIAGTALKWNNGFEEKFPLSFALGAKYKVFGPGAYWSDWFDQRVDFYTDLRLEEGGSFFNTGAEYWLNERLALRAGVNQSYTVDGGNNDAKFTKFVAGLGFNWHNFYFDYAYNPGDDIAANVTHFFTAAYRFDTPTKPALVEPAVLPQVSPPPLLLRKRMFVDTYDLPFEDQVLLEDVGFLGFMIGYGGGIFAPRQDMTRRELMLVVTRLLEREGRDPRGAQKYFPDIEAAYLPEMDKASSYGILRGYPDGLARVERPVLRAEAGGVFARYAGISAVPLDSADIYADVPPGHWAYKDINLTKQHYLTEGIGRDLYRPDEYLLRIDAARVVSRIDMVKQLRSTLPEIEGLTYIYAYDGTPAARIIYVTPAEHSRVPAIDYKDVVSPAAPEPRPKTIKELEAELELELEKAAEADKQNIPAEDIYTGDDEWHFIGDPKYPARPEPETEIAPDDNDDTEWRWNI
ncbi:MAG: S-layer homology domain-containing protein [Candidatus Margulisbacteria bacterium]|nr:S-layer homology domain-containing protein [Candidatus Margulisiibacteriota bacterium]